MFNIKPLYKLVEIQSTKIPYNAQWLEKGTQADIGLSLIMYQIKSLMGIWKPINYKYASYEGEKVNAPSQNRERKSYEKYTFFRVSYSFLSGPNYAKHVWSHISTTWFLEQKLCESSPYEIHCRLLSVCNCDWFVDFGCSSMKIDSVILTKPGRKYS